MADNNQDLNPASGLEDDDLDLGALGAAWRSQTPKVDVDFSAAYRQQKRRRMWFALDLVQALVLLVASVGFLLFLPTSAITVIASVVLFFSGLIVGQQAFSIHRQVLDYADWTAAGLLTFRCMHLRASLRHLRINQLGCVITLAFTLLLYLLNAFRVTEVPETLLAAFGYLVLPTLILLAYFQVRVKRSQVLMAQAEKMKAEFDAA
ncbi:hypothetical protein [Simiduia agarivorans]|uniref:Uncharacterized protein n=1 Tax=Simiduia agarivorans (strain DSM 21679 / JCM 13881 / BCRC 17597 / SA1) TaxID=1117647 RepID=K4KM16_SIMAS|nr:hypothetical protein [Simiduia agarivorans]AFU99123.1 hypothetical protein M5M_09700 [Simiduia agarivorans SA1 = DSM 21679]